MTLEMSRALLAHVRPLHVSLAALAYALGASVSRYLGLGLSMPVFWLGLSGFALAQASMGLLTHVFLHGVPAEPRDAQQTLAKAIRDAALLLAIGCLAVSAVIAYALFREGRLSAPALLYLACSLMLVISYSVPPLKLVDKGLGEAVLAVHIGYIGPSIGFLLQSGRYHSLLSALVVTITLLLVAMFAVYGLASYAKDMTQGCTSLVTRLGWERALWVHHGALILAYAVIGGAILSGFSPALLAPAFLSLPFAVLQVLLLRGLELGARPLWNLLRTNAVAIFGLTTYFLGLGLWMR